MMWRTAGTTIWRRRRLGKVYQQSSTGDEPHATQLFHLNHNIDPNTSSTLVSVSQEIANSWSTSELVYPEFAGDHLMSDDEIIHHSFGGDYFWALDFRTDFSLTGERVQANWRSHQILVCSNIYIYIYSLSTSHYA